MEYNDRGWYPIFVPPEPLAEKSTKHWTKQEAESYFKWFVSVIPDRVSSFLKYFGEESSQDNCKLLESIGDKFANALTEPEFSTQTATKRKLTNRGYALAADAGLLLATCLIKEGGGKVSWQILRKEKRDMSYNLPVLTGFHTHLDPVAGMIAEASGILRGDCSGDILKRTFEFWKSKPRKEH